MKVRIKIMVKKLIVTSFGTLLLGISGSSVSEAFPGFPGETNNTWNCYSSNQLIGTIKSNTTVRVYNPFTGTEYDLILGDISTENEAINACSQVFPISCEGRCSVKKV